MSFNKITVLAFTAAAGLTLLAGCTGNPNGPDANEQGKPTFTAPLQDQAAVFGEAVTFTVAVEGDPTPTLQWYKDGTALPGKTEATLVITGVVLADAGTYIVKATNSKGSVSDTAVLVISGGEPVIGAQSASDTVAPGETVVLFAQVTGEKPFVWQWYKNETAISGATDSVLVLSSITADDLGSYKVIVTNSVGADTSHAITISMKEGILFISESDFQSGLLEWASTSNNTVSSSNLSIYSDAVLKSFGEHLFIIERYGADNIMKFDPSRNDQSGVLYQIHLGDNWNPQDIEFVSAAKAYISNMNEPKITIFNPSTGAVVSHIDISAYTFRPDSNSSPYAGDLQLVGTDMYVMLQRRHGYKPGAPTLILRVDTSTDKVVDTVSLQFTNGYAMAYYGGALYVSNPGSAYSSGDGAIEKVDLSTKTVSTVIDETTLGGSPNQIVHKSGSHFYITNYIGWKNVKVLEIDVSTGAVVATLPGVIDAFGGIYYDDVDGKLYVGERDADEMGVRVFKDNVQVGSTIKSSNSLPPTGMVIVR